MKTKTTKKYIREHYPIIIEITGGADIQTLLTFEQAAYYTTRVEGWAADIYELYIPEYGYIAIVTGYSPFGNIKANYEFCKPYEERARKYCENHAWDNNYPYSRKKKYLHDRLVNMCKKAIAANNK